jgi:restriction system protein
MAIPKHDEIRIPALMLLADKGQLKLSEFEAPLATHFKLSAEEIHEEYGSGNGKVFYDRISWALSYMNLAGLVIKPKRGIYEISTIGREKLKTPNLINEFISEELNKRQKILTPKLPNLVQINETSLTPQEELYTSANKIRQSRYQELLDIIISKSPREFEKLVITLLQKMGYGGQIKESGLVTPYTNDGGIDGIIKEDVLGLGRIHIQAKRYALSSNVGREEIQKFVGALAVVQSNKGVFITTSSFTSGAIEYARSLNGATTLILIDGQKLAQYLYDYGVGVQTEQVIEIKKIDSDFWDEMDND